jgi:hypothetical protein
MNIYKPPPNYYLSVFTPLLISALSFEKMAQERIIYYLDGKYHLISTCSNSEYDFELSNGARYEVKTDFKCVTTGNIYIEFLQFGKPSGINKTYSNFYIIIVPYPTSSLYLLIDVLELQILISNCKYAFIVQPNEYNYYTAGYIFELQELIKYCLIL